MVDTSASLWAETLLTRIEYDSGRLKWLNPSRLFHGLGASAVLGTCVTV